MTGCQCIPYEPLDGPHPLSNRSAIDQINYQYNYSRPPLRNSPISHLWQDEGDLGILSLNREKTPQESKARVFHYFHIVFPLSLIQCTPYRSLQFQISPLQRLLFATSFIAANGSCSFPYIPSLFKCVLLGMVAPGSPHIVGI